MDLKPIKKAILLRFFQLILWCSPKDIVLSVLRKHMLDTLHPHEATQLLHEELKKRDPEYAKFIQQVDSVTQGNRGTSDKEV